MKNFLIGEGDLEAIFNHIKGLSYAQRKHVALMFKPGDGKKKPFFLQLYEALLKQETFDEAQVRNLFASKNFVRLVQTLIEKLIYTQMFHEKEEKPRLYLIESALNLGAIEGVRKALTEELQTAYQQEEFEAMFRMMGWVDSARRIYGIDLIPALAEDFPSRRQIVDHLSFEQEMAELLDACEIGFEFGFPQREVLLLQMQALVHKAKTHFHFPSRVCSHLLRRLQVRASLLGGEANAALDEQALLLKRMLAYRTYTNGEICQEILLLIHLLAGLGREEEALQALHNMSHFPAKTPVEENLRFQFVQKAKVGLALFDWNLDLALEAYQGISERPPLFRSHTLVDLSLKIATTLFVHGKMKDASRHLRELIQHPDVERYAVRAWAELLLIASYHDRGEADLAHDAWRRAKSVVEKADISYAELVYKLLGNVLKTASLAEEDKVAKELLPHFMSELAKSQTAICVPLFDVLQWLEARRRKMSCFMLNQAGESAWVWTGNFQELDLAGSLGGIVYPVGGL